MCTNVKPIPRLSDAWRVLALVSTPEAIMEEETLGRFLQKIVRPSIQTLRLTCKGPSDTLCHCIEVKALNCEPAAVERYRGLVEGWLQMRVLHVKSRKVVKKPNPQKDTSGILLALWLKPTQLKHSEAGEGSQSKGCGATLEVPGGEVCEGRQGTYAMSQTMVPPSH